MVARPRVQVPTEYGSDATPQGFWTEWPSGLVDVSRTSHIPPVSGDSQVEPPPLTSALLDIPVHGDRIVRVQKNCTALVIIDMQKLIHSSSLFLFQTLTAGIQSFFLHPELRDHSTGLKCVEPLMKVVPALRDVGIKILWV
jgi:hypothetical protein